MLHHRSSPRRAARLPSGAALLVGLVLSLVRAHPLVAQQPLETETARLPRRGEAVLSTTYEFQTSGQGTEHALPFALEYGLTNRLTVLVEPVFFTSIRPRGGRNATGLGDIEATLQWLTLGETGHRPALALAAEAKIPTATNRQIGTGRADFTPYLIASKRFGPIDAHANLGYSFVGKPPGLVVQNTVNVAFALEEHLSPHVEVVGEVLSTSAAAGAGEGEASARAPELAGAEQVGMLGLRYLFGRFTWVSLGVTYDNTKAVLVRPGITVALP